MSSKESYNYFCMFTPEGKIAPIESVHRSTMHGGVCVALKNKTSGIIIAQRTSKNDKFTDGKNKIKQLDKNLVYTYSGITNDGVQFGEELKKKIQKEKYRTGVTLPITKLIEDQQVDNALGVMRYGKRATGVSVILLGIEKNKIQLIEVQPTGEALPSFGICIGARAQSARTILESHSGSIEDLSDNALLDLGIAAFKNAINDEEVLTTGHYDICTLSIEHGLVWKEAELPAPTPQSTHEDHHSPQ
ncbi:20S proteasome subunit alpha 6 [Nematocida sp. AWRm80]|nr:20S proteasome subunit alpha 6 [Nematocida sp. AWRm80]